MLGIGVALFSHPMSAVSTAAAAVVFRCTRRWAGSVATIITTATTTAAGAADSLSVPAAPSQLLCRLLNYACRHDVPVPDLDKLLHAEITWLHQVKVGTLGGC